jgi:NAD(P)-dependent dehydrogenase (short-subunit alcohol dehydrogenase family)
VVTNLRSEAATELTTVLITGASSGIGRVTARLFATRGYRVFGTSRRIYPADRGVEMLRLDVRSEESVAECVSEVVKRAGGLDVLVNNAGVEYLGIAEETTIADAQAVFDTNFFGVARMVNAVLPLMRARRHGHIVNIGSAAAWVGEPGEAFYAASKRALAGYTEALRHEVWPLGIHVTLVEPGAFKTDILAAQQATTGKSIADYDRVRRAAIRTLEQGLERGGDPAAVSRVILRVARTKAPRLRYGVGREAYWIPFARVLLPQRWFDVLVRKGFGLTKEVGPRKDQKECPDAARQSRFR